MLDIAQTTPALATGATFTPNVANNNFQHILDLVLATSLLVKTLSREERVVRLSLGQKYYEKRAHALSVSCLQEDVDSSPYLYMRYPDGAVQDTGAGCLNPFCRLSNLAVAKHKFTYGSHGVFFWKCNQELERP